jgi:soluble P-type ATPase
MSDALDIHLVSADTFGTLDAIAERLTVGAVRASSGEVRVLDELGRERCVVIGNGANDAPALAAAALAIAVLGPEGASTAALRSADVVCGSVADALDLLLDPKALSATLRT